MKKMFLPCGVVALLALTSGSVEAAPFAHGLSGTKPWTNERFLDDPQEFHFAVVPDRTGGERTGFFGEAIKALNLLRPEFVMSVGDLIQGGSATREARDLQWVELEGFIARLEMPFFYVVGNHDIWTGINGMTRARRESIELWQERHGTNTYYNFTYKGCHFVCLDSMDVHNYFPPREPLSQRQLDWAAGEIERHADARWTFIFMHKPLDWTSDRWLAFERRINRFNYTVFCGDWHTHCTAVRHGKKYYMIGTAGGCFDGGVVRDDLRHGIMDSITWVTMTKKGPVVSNLALSGIHGDTVQTCATTQGWIEAPLDYPSHRSENPAQYKDETNAALVPTEVMQGPGYDWHFRHAIILRQGCIYAKYPQQRPASPRIVLLGDETASALASDYEKKGKVFDFGFAGDRIENVLWRVVEGALIGYEPEQVVISVGRHNRGKNSEAEIAAGVAKLVQYVRARVPSAEIVIK